jgi:hypothetical protein
MEVWAASSFRASDSVGFTSGGGISKAAVGMVAMVRSGLSGGGGCLDASFPSAIAERLVLVGLLRVTVSILETTTAVVCETL